VVFYPVLEQSPLAEFDEAQQKQLLSGKAILADMTMPDGKKSAAFVQIDTETKQVMGACRGDETQQCRSESAARR